MNKFVLFQSLVYGSSVDCFCFTETWLSSDIGDGEILSCDYKLYRRDRTSRGGGVLIAVSNRISSRLLCASLTQKPFLLNWVWSPSLLYAVHTFLPPALIKP